MNLGKKKIFFVLILLLALFLRLINLNNIEVKTDEGNYAMRAIGWNDFMMSTTLTTPWVWYIADEKLPWWTALSFNDHPPLHFASIWFSTMIFGVSLWSVRLPAVIFGVLSIMMIMIILKMLNFRKGAYWAGLFMAISPWHIYISRQAIQESQLIFLILLTIWLFKKTEAFKWYWWFLAGISLGLSILTKYSAVIILPLLVYWFFAKKWYKNKYFWQAPLVTIITLLPVIIYNFYVYKLRGHFDLQVSRFLKMDTTKDWVASEQGIWQGDIKSLISFVYSLAQWISIPLAIFILIGLLLVIIKKRKLARDSLILSIGMVSAVGFTCLMTLGDFGRASIMLPFIAILFGLTAEILIYPNEADIPTEKITYFKKIKHHIFKLVNFLAKRKIMFAAITGCLLLTFLVTISDNTGKSIIKNNLAFSFYHEPWGFTVWDDWLHKNFNPHYNKKHFRSFKDWVGDHIESINQPDAPIIVYDNRINWFALNWYFYTYSMNCTDVPVVHASVFSMLAMQGLLDIDKKIVYYVQVNDAAQDTKALLDDASRVTDQAFRKLYEDQGTPEPIILKNSGGKDLLSIYKLRWDDNIVKPILAPLQNK